MTEKKLTDNEKLDEIYEDVKAARIELQRKIKKNGGLTREERFDIQAILKLNTLLKETIAGKFINRNITIKEKLLENGTTVSNRKEIVLNN